VGISWQKGEKKIGGGLKQGPLPCFNDQQNEAKKQRTAHKGRSTRSPWDARMNVKRIFQIRIRTGDAQLYWGKDSHQGGKTTPGTGSTKNVPKIVLPTSKGKEAPGVLGSEKGQSY